MSATTPQWLIGPALSESAYRAAMSVALTDLRQPALLVSFLKPTSRIDHPGRMLIKISLKGCVRNLRIKVGPPQMIKKVSQDNDFVEGYRMQSGRAGRIYSVGLLS